MEKEELRTLVEEIAKQLGSEWFVEPWSQTFKLTAGDMTLSFSQPYNLQDRLEIRGSFDYGLSQYLPYRGDQAREKTDITVSLSKSPEKIAHDITIRLLPPYKRMLAYAQEHKAKDDEYKYHKKNVLKQVIIAIGGDAQMHRYDENIVYGYEPYRFEAKHWTGDDLEIKITLPMGQALKVLKYIKLKSPSGTSPNHVRGKPLRGG